MGGSLGRIRRFWGVSDIHVLGLKSGDESLRKWEHADKVDTELDFPTGVENNALMAPYDD